MAKKPKKESGSGRMNIVVTPKAWKELLDPLKIENLYDPTLITFEDNNEIKIHTFDDGKSTMFIFEGKIDGIRVVSGGEMVVNPKEMLTRVLAKFGSHKQFIIEEQTDGAYRFYDEFGAELVWTPDSKSECRIINYPLLPKETDDGHLELFGGKMTTELRAEAKAKVFQMAGEDAAAANAEYIELNINHDQSYSESGHLVAGTIRSKTPLDIDIIDGDPVAPVVPSSFSKFVSILTGDVVLHAKAGAPAIILEGREPDKKYSILLSTTVPTEAPEPEPEEEEPEEEE
jgi:hypothetical protein